MDHDRRRLIRSIGGAGAVLALAGCVTSEDATPTQASGGDEEMDGDGGGGDGGGDGGGESDGGDGGMDEDTATPTEEPQFREAGEARLWHDFSDADQENLESDIETFQEASGHVIKPEAVGGLNDQLNTAVPSGEGPDTWGFAHDWIGPFEDKGWLLDLSDHVSFDPAETYKDVAVDAMTYEDGVYGLPYAAETVGLVWNRDMIDSPPETIDELISIAEEFHDPASGEYGVSMLGTNAYFVSAYIHAFGGFYYRDEGNELGFTNEETIRGVETIRDAFWEYNPQDQSYEAQVAVFSDGNAPLAIQGPWAIGGFRDAGIDVGVTTLPTVEGNDPSPYTGVQLWYLNSAVADDDSAQRTSLDFAEWYTTSDSVIRRNADELGFVPVHEEITANMELDDVTQAFEQNVSMGTPMPAGPRMDQVWGPAAEALDRILNQGQDIEAAMEQAEEEVRSAWEEADY